MKKRNNKKQNKEKAKVNQQGNLKQQWQNNWKAKTPVLLFLLGFLVFVIAFYLLYYSDWYRTTLREPILSFQAFLGGGILKILGYDVYVQGSLIAGDQFAINIKNGCDGLEATTLFTAAVLMFPLAFKYKWPGILGGVAVLFVVNLIRTAGLYMIGVHWESAFEFFHLHGGLILFMIVSISI
ncbi:MAG: archaeosortase/exosortase family protein, partial [Bacteroidota bacterium]